MLWGADSIWYGSPQDQIQTFRTVQIADERQAAHDYPRLTPALRRVPAAARGRAALGRRRAERENGPASLQGRFEVLGCGDRI